MIDFQVDIYYKSLFTLSKLTWSKFDQVTLTDFDLETLIGKHHFDGLGQSLTNFDANRNNSYFQSNFD